MTLDEALRALGVTSPFTDADVRAAFSRALRLAHPDIGGGAADAATNIARAQRARTLLMSIVAGDAPCRTCKGAGSVRGSFAMRVCTDCNGSGKDVR